MTLFAGCFACQIRIDNWQRLLQAPKSLFRLCFLFKLCFAWNDDGVTKMAVRQQEVMVQPVCDA
jgi:hypothetical protein